MMSRKKTLLLGVALAAAGGFAAWWRSTAAERAARPIVERNVAARGGLDAWRRIKTMSMAGSVEAGAPRDPVKQAMAFLHPDETRAAAKRAALHHTTPAPAKQVELPFRIELARPRRSRVEVVFQGQTSVQVFDGDQGWKVRPFLGRHEVEPFSDEELRQASQQADLDGLLIDHAAKGNKVELVGKEKVDGRDAFHLAVTLRTGQVRHVWVDADTYLDVKVDGTRRMDGKPKRVFTQLGDYRRVEGVMVPFLLETSVAGVAGSEAIRVERVAVNPPLDEARFARPD